MSQRRVLAALVLSFLLSLSPLAADPVIHRGIDVFTTVADGKTYYNFAENPVPAGFFCNKSRAFTERVALKGLPLSTQSPGQLRDADTIIERLDDAAFDSRGVATTRIRFRALSMVSVSPIKTACGSFHVYVSLNGKQRMTTMKVHRTQNGGGTFFAPLAANVRISFIPVKAVTTRSARKLEIAGTVNFPARPLPWSFEKTAWMKSINSVTVDTNGDLKPDSPLPGTSNFSPGFSPDFMPQGPIGACPCEPTCHYSSGEQHCYMQTDNCFPVICP